MKAKFSTYFCFYKTGKQIISEGGMESCGKFIRIA